MNDRMPVAFAGHGNPMNALADNQYTRAWNEMGRSMRHPRAILSISAHWYTQGSLVTANLSPPTIHDFGGFPQALFDVRYPAPGDASLTQRVVELLAPLDVSPTDEWGLDHGTWSVLCHMFPEASIPVVQLSIDRTVPPQTCLEIGAMLRPLRDEDVFILCSGNIVHNLRAFMSGATPHNGEAERFERYVADRLTDRDFEPLARYERIPGAHFSVPTPEHYLPILYAAGASHESDAVEFPSIGIDAGCISMLSVQYR